MTCSRCSAEAVVKRGAATYCAKCALARDWEEIVMIVQEDRVEVTAPSVDFDDGSAAVAEPKKAGAAVVKADPQTNGELPADPFA